MDNLLPTLASFDVTSNQFRESALPYQQWEAARTHNTPTTPSYVDHLLPPIGVRKPSRDSSGNPLPIPPAIEPSLPRPAPVDRNVLDLYDSALDPSPIGKEERGATQPVRISRVVPRPEFMSAGKGSRGVKQPEQLPASSTLVTVLNGHTTQRFGEDWESNPGFDDENCIDIFVEGFSRGIDHTTLLPAELFCRTLQNGSQGPPSSSSPLPGEAPYSLNAREGSLGLTVLLTRTGEWFDAVDGVVQGSRKEHPVKPSTSVATQDQDRLAADANVTQMMFQRDDGQPGPSRNAFRVQFEPGPLGIELEEHPGTRGIVQVRQVLQAGQAELDGRLPAGCFVVAVGDWGESGSSARPPSSPSGGLPEPTARIAHGADLCGSFYISDLKSNSGGRGSSAKAHKPAIIRTLVEFEEAVSSRQPDRLFVVWALDRHAPEAIAALGRQESNHVRPIPNEWSSGSLYARPQKGSGRTSYSSDNERRRHFNPSNSSSVQRSNSLDNSTKPGVLEGAPGWESGFAFANGKDSLEYSLSSNEPGWVPYDRNRPGEGGDRRIRGAESEGNLPASAFGSPTGNKGGEARSVSEERHRIDRTSGNGENSRTINRLRTGVMGTSGEWEFETGGGIFDEDDQGIAARRHPARNQVAVGATTSTDDEAENTPPFPLGLQASMVDEFAVFLWFYNNHESATMNVSWIDYKGKRVPRRSLAPGACYFERSFATHPWVIHSVLKKEESNDGGVSRSRGDPNSQQRQEQPPHRAHDQQECCVVRLGDAMALARLTGSLIWNPTGRTLSIAKQAKVSLPGMSAAAHAAIGSSTMDGAGLDPGMKRLCMAGPRRDEEEARAMAGRAAARKEKANILQEMKTWRTHPLSGGGVGVGGNGGDGQTVEGAVAGLGQGVPNLRVVMIGSSEWSE